MKECQDNPSLNLQKKLLNICINIKQMEKKVSQRVLCMYLNAWGAIFHLYSNV